MSVESSGGDKRETVILNPNLHLSEEELAKAMERINSIRLSTEVHRDQKLFGQALSLYEQLGDERRAELGRGLEIYCGAQDTQDVINMRRAEEYLSELVERFQRELSEDPFEQLRGLGLDADREVFEDE